MNESNSGNESCSVKAEVESPKKPISVECSTASSNISTIDEEETEEVWKFMIEEARDIASGRWLPNCYSPCGTELWKLYKFKSGSSTSLESLLRAFSDNLSNKIMTTNLDETTKVKLHFSYNIPADLEFLENLRKNADVDVCENGCILMYKERKEGGLSLSRDDAQLPMPAQEEEEQAYSLGDSDTDEKSLIVSSESSARRHRYTDEDETSMWNFLLKKIKDPETGEIQRRKVFPKGNAVWKEYKQTYNTERAEDALSTRYRRQMAPRLHLAKLGIEAKVNLYYALSIPVNNMFLDSLRMSANVRVDTDGCIVQYRKRVKTEVNSPAEQKVNSSFKVKMERKRSLKEETSSPEAKKAPPQDNDKSANIGVVDPHFTELLKETVGTSSSSDFAPLKRVQIGEDVYITEAVNLLLETQSRKEANAINEAEIQPNDERGHDNDMKYQFVGSGDPTMDARRELGSLSSREEDSRETSSASPEEQPFQSLSRSFEGRGSSSGVPLKYLLDSLKEVIVEQNNELINAFKTCIPVNNPSKEIPRREQTPRIARPSSNKISTKEFLTSLKTMIVSLNSSSLNNSLEKVNDLISKAENEGNEIPMKRIEVILEATMAMVPN